MRHIESKLQQACVQWFRAQYPKYARLLIAVPNGGYRNAREAGRMKSEGVVSGVADMLLLIPKGPYGCLGIEFKTGKGKQSELQFEWQNDFHSVGNVYMIVRCFESFVELINSYLEMK